MAASCRVTAQRKIRVLYILDAFDDPQAGTELQFWTLLQHLDRERFEPSIVLLRASPFLEGRSGVPVKVLHVSRLRSPGSIWRILRVAIRARRSGIDVAHLFFNDVSIAFPMLLRLAGIPTIVSRRDLGFWHSRNLVRLLRFNAPFVSTVIANCEAVRHAVIGAERFAPQKVHVIYNALVRQPCAQGTDLRARLGLPANAKLVVIVANLRPLKRIADAVQALAQIVARFPDAYLVIVGEDRPGETEPSHRAELVALSVKLRLADHVLFLGKQQDPMPTVTAADVCVLCSESEGLSNAVMEYMVAGKPTVCTNVGGNAELVVDNHTGYLVTVGNITLLANSIAVLLSDPKLAKEFGLRARRRATELFSLRWMIEQHAALYTKLAVKP